MMRTILIGLGLGGCANTTGGELITLPFVAGGVARDATQPFAFTTPTGWTVTLDQALISAGPFYFNVDPPPTDEFRAGTVIIQATEQTIIDALDPTLHAVAGGANGETGTSVSVEIGLLPPDQPDTAAFPADAALLGAGFAYVAGTAVDGALTVPFAGQAIIDQSLVTTTQSLPALERIAGAGAELTFTAAKSQQLELRVDPTHWFDQSEFSEIPTGSWTVDTTFAEQLLQGLKGETAVYLFSK